MWPVDLNRQGNDLQLVLNTIWSTKMNSHCSRNWKPVKTWDEARKLGYAGMMGQLAIVFLVFHLPSEAILIEQSTCPVSLCDVI